ncbi:hypothetical protein Tco_1548712 [Tanacetum coccineum]
MEPHRSVWRASRGSLRPRKRTIVHQEAASFPAPLGLMMIVQSVPSDEGDTLITDVRCIAADYSCGYKVKNERKAIAGVADSNMYSRLMPRMEIPDNYG